MTTRPVELIDEEEYENSGRSDEFSDDSSDYDGENAEFPIILILSTGIWTILYAVFSFGFDMDPDSCIVSNKDDLISGHIPFVDSDNLKDPNTTDVAVRFKFFFDAAFFCSCA